MDRRIRRLLPLRPAWFHILLALKEGEGHGFAIRERVEARTEGRVRLWPATLYGAIHQLAEKGLIEPLAPGAEPEEDARRRYYRLTELGRSLLLAEADRLESLVRDARSVRASAS